MHKKKTCMAFYFITLFLMTGIISCSSSSNPVNTDSEGLAIKGYDTVAYFTEGKPVKGNRQFSHEWNDAKWLFASKENLDLFAAAPEKYAPQYGGY